MTQPVILRLSRPYDSVDAYLESEAWCFDRKSIVLVDQDELESGTIVRFELTLRDGERVLRAEGKVLGPTDPRDDRPAGLNVRFRRFDASTKAMIERAVQFRLDVRKQAEADRATDELLEATDDSSPEAADGPRRPLPSLPDLESSPSAVVEPISLRPDDVAADDDSGIRSMGTPIAPPKNRDELLAKLRARAATLAKVTDVDDSRDEEVG